MKVKYELEESDYDYIYDVYWEAIGETPTNKEIDRLFDAILSDNENLVCTAAEWGWGDTVVRDNLFEYMQVYVKKYTSAKTAMKP